MFEMNGTVVIMIQTYPLEWVHWQQPSTQPLNPLRLLRPPQYPQLYNGKPPSGLKKLTSLEPKTARVQLIRKLRG
jgi:hypothetical protein